MEDCNTPKQEVIVASEVDRPAEVSIASSLIPYDRDDPTALYLGYRACGFSVREALVMISRSKAWLSEQRHDPRFVELEGKIPDFRRDLSKEYTEIEFFRNFRLVMEKDRQILYRSLGLEKDDENEVVKMTPADTAYLLKMRSQYTPQQLGMLESIVKGGANGFDFSKWVAEHGDIVKLSRTESITVKR